MRIGGSGLILSASDLSHFLACRHRTALDLAVAHGLREPPRWVDPALAVLQERGLEHERAYADSLRAQGLSIADLASLDNQGALAPTIEAMRAAVDVILQAAFLHGRWFGRPDILRRVETPSTLGPWSYEVYDTKLARETRGGTILQLALYSDLLATAQGVTPEQFHVVTPDPERPVETYRTSDFAAYYRLVRARLEETILEHPEAIAAAHYPEPCEHCDICRWWSHCDKRRRGDDHLSLVAGISRLQTRELQAAGVATLAALGTLPVPLPFQPRRGAAETYERVREQARLQLAGRTQNVPVHKLLPIVPGQGLARLPAPSAGDVFLDLEGDPFARAGGREYLFGWVTLGPGGTPSYRGLWAASDAEERAAFETFVDSIVAAWLVDPAMHVYHYAPYEPAALKRLMGRYATREAEVDRMLRAGLFVDLYAVVKHAVRASVERYSIKDLEPFYAFTREVDLADARTHLRVVERALELRSVGAITDEVRRTVEGYNRDDCVSAWQLRNWLERLRASVEAGGTPVPRPTLGDPAPPEEVDAREQRTRALGAALTADVPVDRAERSPEQDARWLLAQLLGWHRRESKAPWWEFFRLRELSEQEFFDERAGLSGLAFVARIGGTQNSPIDRYTYPPQESEIGEGDPVFLSGGVPFGTVDALDRVARTPTRTIDVKKRAAQAGVHPLAVFTYAVVNADVLADAVARIAEDVVQTGMAGGGRYRAARSLLHAEAPRLRSGAFQAGDGETPIAFARRIVSDLDDTALAIQGPPGAGKTYTGARMIVELVRRGLRVGVTALSHKVIRHLLEAARDAGTEAGLALRCVQKVSSEENPASAIPETAKNAEIVAQILDGRAQIAGGTPWLWARPELQGAVDVLFVDEAGQMSLANVVAASQAARSLVLLGDPQQLEQPQQGTHPEGSDASALEHILQDHKTIPSDRGIFLPETFRLSPGICAFTSEVFYEGRLRSRPGLERQLVGGTQLFNGAGLYLVPVTHEGNQNASLEEVDAVAAIVQTLLRPGAFWIDKDGLSRAMTVQDILVVAPYNAQVSLLGERLLPLGVRVGTVDKFQGQEAPVVLYSMATSRPEDAPRGMEFLYSLHRLNVASSRARCAFILVASPRLLEPECKSPRQMQLANALARFAELSAWEGG